MIQYAISIENVDTRSGFLQFATITNRRLIGTASTV